MKRIICICSIIVFGSSVSIAQSQDTIVTYYDSDWIEISNPDSASYYGKTYKNKENLWVALDFYKSGQLQMRGSYKTPQKEERHGLFEYFYENGQLKSRGNTTDGNKEGGWTVWFEDGQIREEIVFKTDKRNGELYTYWRNGQMKRRDIFTNDEFVRGEVWDSLGTKDAYYPYMQMPKFKGGDERLFRYLATKTKYPPKARKNGIEGTVLMQFIVQKDGTISNVRVLEGVHELLDEEAIRVISSMPKWKAGMQDGETVEVSFGLPLRFVIPK